MTEEVSELLKRAQAHPAEGWAALAGSLLDSLEETVDLSAETAWSEEIASYFRHKRSSGTVSWDSCLAFYLLSTEMRCRIGDGESCSLAVPSFSN